MKPSPSAACSALPLTSSGILQGRNGRIKCKQGSVSRSGGAGRVGGPSRHPQQGLIYPGVQQVRPQVQAVRIRQLTSPGCPINQLSQPHSPGMGDELKTMGVTWQEIAPTSPLHHSVRGCRGGSKHRPSWQTDPETCSPQRLRPPTLVAHRPPDVQPTATGPHPQHHSQLGHPAPLLPAPLGRAAPLPTPHCRTAPARLGDRPTPAPPPHASQPWGLSLDGGGFRGRMLNCIAQLSNLQSLLLAPALPFSHPTTTRTHRRFCLLSQSDTGRQKATGRSRFSQAGTQVPSGVTVPSPPCLLSLPHLKHPRQCPQRSLPGAPQPRESQTTCKRCTKSSQIIINRFKFPLERIPFTPLVIFGGLQI